MNREYYLKLAIICITFVIISFFFAFITPIRIETSGTFVVVSKQDELTIIANITDISFWVYTNKTTGEGYFSEWLETNKTIKLSSDFYEKAQINHVYQLVSKYNIFNMLCEQRLQEWY